MALAAPDLGGRGDSSLSPPDHSSDSAATGFPAIRLALIDLSSRRSKLNHYLPTLGARRRPAARLRGPKTAVLVLSAWKPDVPSPLMRAISMKTNLLLQAAAAMALLVGTLPTAAVEGKGYGAVGIGRHGNVLQWGYSMPPSKMTDPGRKLFLNCICYIEQFAGKPPLVRAQASHRDNALRLAALVDRIDDERFFRSAFPEELRKYEDDPEALVAHYQAGYELIYRDGVFRIDAELESLGLLSNREVRTLQRLIALLEDDSKADIAGRLLRRYTELDFDTAAEWRQWHEASGERVFFSDVGGYKFLVAPAGYLGR